jgi:hypothetical protein
LAMEKLCGEWRGSIICRYEVLIVSTNLLSGDRLNRSISAYVLYNHQSIFG